MLAERADRAARGCRVGRVGLDEDLRLVAAVDARAEIARDDDEKGDVAPLDEPLGLRVGLRPGDEAVVVADLKRRDDGARIMVLPGREQRGVEPLRIGVDGVAEQDELHDRDAEHHREGDAVAPHLDEFLGEHRAEADEKQPHHAALAGGVIAPTLAVRAPMKWMNTSSRLVRPGSIDSPCAPA